MSYAIFQIEFTIIVHVLINLYAMLLVKNTV